MAFQQKTSSISSVTKKLAIDSVLTLREIKKKYKEFQLGGLDLTFPKGFITGIIGPNGAGKSTTIKIIMNMVKADSGKLSVFGLDYRKSEKEIKNRIGYVGEEQYFYSDKTVDWTGRFVSQYYTNWDESYFRKLLSDFKLSPTKKTKELSKGMKVKLSLALALSHDPELIILDEPTAGLDPVVRRELLDLLMEIVEEEKRSVVISSHITDDISRVADFVAFMIDGKIRIFSDKNELLSSWKKIHFKEDALDADVKSGLFNLNESAFAGTGIARDYSLIEDKIGRGLASGNIKISDVDLDDILISYVKAE